MPRKETTHANLSVLVRRLVSGSPEQVFQAWTLPEQIKKWWGPSHVICSECEVDLQVGGHYKLGNLLPDGSTIWIVGEFLRIERPDLLVYSWQSGLDNKFDEPAVEQVTVRFLGREGKTEIIVEHRHIVDEQVKRNHTHGWTGCLDGIEEFCAL